MRPAEKSGPGLLVQGVAAAPTIIVLELVNWHWALGAFLALAISVFARAAYDAMQ